MELLKFTSRAINGVNFFMPPKFDFVFYEDRVEMYKKDKLIRTISYSDIIDTAVQKTYRTDFVINCKPIGIVICKVSDEHLNKIKEIIKK